MEPRNAPNNLVAVIDVGADHTANVATHLVTYSTSTTLDTPTTHPTATPDGASGPGPAERSAASPHDPPPALVHFFTFHYADEVTDDFDSMIDSLAKHHAAAMHFTPLADTSGGGGGGKGGPNAAAPNGETGTPTGGNALPTNSERQQLFRLASTVAANTSPSRGQIEPLQTTNPSAATINGPIGSGGSGGSSGSLYIASSLAFVQQPSNTTAGNPITPAVSVEVLNQFGTLDTTDNSDPITVTATGPGAFTSGSTTTLTVSGGVASFDNLVLTTPGSYTLSASATLPGASGGGSSGSRYTVTSSSFTVTSSVADHLGFIQQPTNAAAGQFINPPVEVGVYNASGTLVTTDTSTVTIALNNNGNNGVLNGTLSAPANNGYAIFNDLSIDQAGTGYTLQASDGSLTGATSDPFAITPAAATQFLVSAPSGVTAGSPFSATVTAEDRFGNVAAGYLGIVHFTSTDTATGVVLPSNYPFQSSDQGTHTFSGVVLQTVGSQTITAQDQATPQLQGLAQLVVFAPPGGGLTAFYYNNPDWSGNPAVERVDGTINFEYIQPNGQATNALPGSLDASKAAAGKPHAPFSVGWVGTLSVPAAGNYRFAIGIDTGGGLWIDGTQVIKGDFRRVNGSVLGSPISLTAGNHSIVMLYYEDHIGAAFAALKWSPPGSAIVPVPSRNLTPTSPTVEFWKDIATARISLDNVPQLVGNSFTDIALNVRITAAYAELAQANPKAFIWLGAGSIASNLVGTALKTLRSDILVELKQRNDRIADLFKQAFTDLAKGNQAIYNELYWEHLAFNFGGIALMKTYAALGAVTPAQLAAWQTISDGLAKNDSKLIFQGNAELLRIEQFGIVQRLVFGPIHDILTAGGTPRGLLQPLRSAINRMAVAPLPGSLSFDAWARKNQIAIRDFTDANQRFRWERDDVLTRYEIILNTKPKDITNRFQQYLKNEAFMLEKQKIVGL